MIRVSCATLCRIEHPDGRLLVGLNKNRLRHGEPVLTPYGGAYTFEDVDPLRALDARLERDDSEDLRFFIEEDRLSEFESWFRTRTGRETDPFRELHEELVEEEKLVPAFDRSDLEMQYVDLVTAERETTRGGLQGTLTRYYHEVFDVRLADRLWSDLLPRLGDPETRARLITIAEVRAGETAEGIAVGPNVRHLLRDHERDGDAADNEPA